MSAISYLEALQNKRTEYLNALAIVPDGDAIKHISIKGQIRGLDEAASIFRQQNKVDSEEGDKA